MPSILDGVPKTRRYMLSVSSFRVTPSIWSPVWVYDSTRVMSCAKSPSVSVEPPIEAVISLPLPGRYITLLPSGMVRSPVSVIVISQLLILPLVALAFASLFGFKGDTKVALVLEAAMPTMVIGLVICDRYGLDTKLYATAVTVTTILSLVTLNVWYLVL